MGNSVNEITHKPNGQFAKNNRWMMPQWRPGKSGHTAKYTPNRLITKCNEYMCAQDELEKPYTWSGLALSLGITYSSLRRYRRGEIGQDTAGIRNVLEYFETAIRNQLEMLVSSTPTTALAALKQDHGWEEKSESTVQPKISIVLNSGSQLAQQITDSNSSVIIEQTKESPD